MGRALARLLSSRPSPPLPQEPLGTPTPTLHHPSLPLPALLRAKIEVKVTRPQVTLRLSGGGPYKSFVVTAVSRAKIRGAPAAVSNVKSSNVTLKPAEGGAGALSNKRGPVVLCS